MTYSLIAKDTDGSIGLIVASKFFACGAVVPYVSGTVAVASQAFCNPIWGTEGRARMEAGESARAVIAARRLWFAQMASETPASRNVSVGVA